VRVALLLTAALLVAACRFERRPALSSGGVATVDGVPQPSAADTPMADSVRAVVQALVDALEVGDVSRVAQLTVPGATLLDQEEGLRWSREDVSAPLPRALLAQGEDALAWVLADSQLTPFTDSALLVNEYHAYVAGESVPWKAVETFVLVRTPEGWRARHLHRSRGQLPTDPADER
jgi:ketosteroid isomerase-like protein